MAFFPEKEAFFDFLDVLRKERELGASEVHLFGSRARGDNKTGSDVDIASDVDTEDDHELVRGKRSRVWFSIYRMSQGESFLDPIQPHRTICLKRKK